MSFTSLIIQDRDLAFLTTLIESRALTAQHAAILHFGGSKEAAKKRLQKLKAAGLITERKRRASEPSVLSLAPKAFPLLKERGLLASYPSLSGASLQSRAKVSDLTLAHELEVMDVKSAFYGALKGSKRFTIAEFTTWPLLNQFEARRSGQSAEAMTVKPDGSIKIHEHESNGGILEHTFFLEVDRSSESLDTLVTKASCYLDYYKSGGYALRNGGTRLDFKDYPFRVLMICKTAERRNNVAERLLQHVPPILTQVCLATLKDVVANPLQAFWIRPREYYEAAKDTPYDTSRTAGNWQFRRHGAREIFVEDHVRKIRISSRRHPLPHYE